MKFLPRRLSHSASASVGSRSCMGHSVGCHARTPLRKGFVSGHDFNRAARATNFDRVLAPAALRDFQQHFRARRGGFGRAASVLILFAVSAVVLLLVACSIKVDDKDKENKKVDIQTPLANLKVDTSSASTDNGIPVYPGATIRPDEGGNNHRANVNIGALGFGVKVVAVEYQTPDSPQKVKEYYLDKLAKYGKVLECSGGGDGGGNADIKMGKDDDLDKPVTCKDTKGNGIELKTGTNGNQHLVAIKPDGSGTRFGTVLVQIHGKEGTL